ncbi:hypothetical protein GCM10027610_050390 [Dactylosporangium cerinum]
MLCYAPADMSGWVFIDCFAEHHEEYVPGAGRYEWRRDGDPLVRAVRRPAGDFESGLTLTIYGKVLRWGPGWWLNHPEGLPDEQQAHADCRTKVHGCECACPTACCGHHGEPA